MALMLTFVLVASMCNMSGDNTKAQDNLTFDVQGGLHITLSNTPYTLNLSTSQTFSSLIIDEDTTLILDNNNRSRYMNLTITGNATINGTLTADWHSGPIELNIGKNLTVFENGSIDLSASGTSARGGGYQGLDGYHGRGPGGGESYDAPQGGWQGVGGGASYGTYGTKGEYAGSYEANYGEKYGDSILSQWNNDSYTKTNPYSGVTYNQCVGGSSGAYGATQPGAGGGAIKIFASNINIKGSIETNGGNAPSGDCSGGGSGGTIWLNSSLLTVDGTISSVGGEGARLSNSYAIGGDGGKGRIYFQYDNKDVTGTINPSPVEKYPSTVITENATNVEHNEATLNGIGSSSFGSAIVWFEYGTTTDYGTNTSNVSMDGAYESYAIHISGLESDTEYHYRAVGNDTNTTMVGEDRTFTTISAFNITNPIIPQNNSMSTLCDFWQIDIGEKEGNAFDWWINTTPDVGTASGTDEYNGTKRINMNGLSGGETYTFILYVVAVKQHTGNSYITRLKKRYMNIQQIQTGLHPQD